MNGLEATLDNTEFARLHRSLIVRLDRIASLVHQDHGWAARLVDGTEQRIAKSRLARVMRIIRESSATEKVHSATNDSGHRNPEANERQVIDTNQVEEEKPFPG
jgi:cysteine sulfinate desulfinase/cysteine desulfurase-like protein